MAFNSGNLNVKMTDGEISAEKNVKILTNQDITVIKSCLEDEKKYIKAFVNWIDELIRLGNSNATVQSFYSSGNFGAEVQERLKKIAALAKQYYDVLFEGESSLYSKTLEFCEKQQLLLNSNLNFKRPPLKTPGGPSYERM